MYEIKATVLVKKLKIFHKMYKTACSILHELYTKCILIKFFKV